MSLIGTLKHGLGLARALPLARWDGGDVQLWRDWLAGEASSRRWLQRLRGGGASGA